jgi:hypothetical protein
MEELRRARASLPAIFVELLLVNLVPAVCAQQAPPADRASPLAHGDVARVEDAEALVEAVKSGAKHIVIVHHINFTASSIPGESSTSREVDEPRLQLRPETRSLQVHGPITVQTSDGLPCC